MDRTRRLVSWKAPVSTSPSIQPPRRHCSRRSILRRATLSRTGAVRLCANGTFVRHVFAGDRLRLRLHLRSGHGRTADGSERCGRRRQRGRQGPGRWESAGSGFGNLSAPISRSTSRLVTVHDRRAGRDGLTRDPLHWPGHQRSVAVAAGPSWFRRADAEVLVPGTQAIERAFRLSTPPIQGRGGRC